VDYSVRFSNFWPGSERTIENFFIPLISKISESSVRWIKSELGLVDLEVHSVFNSAFKNSSHSFFDRIYGKLGKQIANDPVTFKRNSNKVMWYSGENFRPPLHLGYDAFLCYEDETYAANCFYLPLWVLNLNWFALPSSHGFISSYNSMSELTAERKIRDGEVKGRKFCCFFANHLNDMRKGALSILSQVGNVDVFGYAGNRSVIDKKLIASQYKFIFCPENDLYPGYVSEKLLEGYQTTALPIYWGIDRDAFFNPQSHLNIYNQGGFSALVPSILEMLADPTLYLEKLNSPLFMRKFDLELLIEKLRNKLL
jgi:hypothetical protein